MRNLDYNYEIEDYLDMPEVQQYRFEASCTSKECLQKNNYTSRGAAYIEVGVPRKNVKKTDIFCSYCGHALFWQRFKI